MNRSKFEHVKRLVEKISNMESEIGKVEKSFAIVIGGDCKTKPTGELVKKCMDLYLSSLKADIDIFKKEFDEIFRS